MSTQLERIFYIDREVNTKGYVTTNELIKHFEISRRTVINDINFMKIQLDCEIVYDKKKNGYRYDKKFDNLNIGYQDFVFNYYFIKSILRSKEYIPFMTNELLRSYSDLLDEKYRKIDKHIDYIVSKHEDVNKNHMALILESFIQSKCLKIKYQKYKELTDYTIQPVKLLNYNSNWYLITYCFERSETRIFKVSYLEKIELIDKNFTENIDEKKIDDYCRKLYGIYRNNLDTFTDDSKMVKIRFHKKIAHLFKNTHFADNQRVICDYKKDYLDVELLVSKYYEILGLVLSFGENAEVLEPKDFKELWLDTIKNMYKQFVKK